MKDWHPDFGPCYTPMEMLDKGIFEGIYTSAIEGIPGKYKKHKNVLPRGSKPDISINQFKVKSRLSLAQWKKNGWIMTDKLGWWEWFLNYYSGRRLGAEDEKQIKRWKSFVARHQGAITKSGKLKDLKARVKQRQGLLQWGWDSTVPYSLEEAQKNAKRIAKSAGAKVTTVSKESLPPSLSW
jgi:hypothetical protein